MEPSVNNVICYKKNKQDWFCCFLLRDFGSYEIIFMNAFCVNNSCHGNAVRDFGPYGFYPYVGL
jgi:hypothetical protein